MSDDAATPAQEGTARPTPRPGPPSPAAMARAKATPRPTTSATSAPVTPASDPTRWGRVDEDGSVYVRTADGERLVGSWQAGDPAEGLAHYGARYDDLATEVALLRTRLETKPQEAAATRTAAEALAAQVPDAAAVGDLDALAAELARIVERSRDVEGESRRRRDSDRAAAIARKEELAAEAETIGSESTQWKTAGDRLHAILDEWKTIRGIDRRTDDALWKRYSRAREAFNRRRGAHFAELDRGRAAARRTKEELVVRAEALSGSTDWNETASAFRALMDEWKAAGRAPRDTDDALWARFKAAQDAFFEARHADAAERDAEFAANAETKEGLLAEFADRIRPDQGLDRARSALRDLQSRWEEAGKVPRHRIKELEARLREIEKRVADAAEVEWRRTDPEAKARAGQFWERVHGFEAQAEKAEAAGRTRDAENARSQAAQWREWALTAENAVETR